MAEPTDFARLRLGQELREIREKLQMSKYRDRFQLESRESVRPGDITQAILDIEPQIIHFSGHGNSAGELCFETMSGSVHPVSPDALNSLFSLVSKKVQCVVINACHSQNQAKAIAEQIPYVIGMSQEIEDKAAIAFSIGFYRALGANNMINDAFKFGCTEIQMEGIPGHSIPVLYQKKVEAKVRWKLTLEITLDELDNQKIGTILDCLRQVSGDTSLKLKKTEEGSVKLILEGSQDGFDQINALIQSGQLKEILGIHIKSLHKESDIPVEETPAFIQVRDVEQCLFLCCYTNTTSKIQVVRITNIPNWYFERVVFPGQRLVFEAMPGALLEIHRGMMNAILADTIPCERLCVELELELEADLELETEVSLEQNLSKAGWIRRTE